LQSTLSKTILSRVLRAIHSYQVWEHIHDHFFTQTKGRARQLRTDLRAQALENKSMREFLGQIKNIADELARIGCLVKLDEYVDAILEGLPQDYTPVISVIESKFETLPIMEVEALLLAHESRTNRFQQKIFPSVNYSEAYVANTRSQVRTNNFHGNFGLSSADRGGCSHNGPGRGGRFANFQCQICLKYGHTTNICFYHGDPSYQPHESLVLYDPTTNQPLQFSTTQFNATPKSNTWINPATTQVRSAPSIDVPVYCYKFFCTRTW